jgi:hypothetical protein
VRTFFFYLAFGLVFAPRLSAGWVGQGRPT